MAKPPKIHTPTRLSFVAPSARLAKVRTDVAAAEKVTADLGAKATNILKGALSVKKEQDKQQAKADRLWRPSPKDFARINKDRPNQGLVAATFLPTRKDNTSQDTEVSPETPELTGPHKKAKPVYHGEKKDVTKDVLTGEGSGRKITPELSGPKLGVCTDCGGKVADHTYASDLKGLPDKSRMLHPRTPAGAPRIGGHGDSSHVAPTGKPRIPTDTSSARMVRTGAVGRQGGKPHDIKDRNIETPEKPTEKPSKVGTFVSPDELAKLRANKKPEAVFAEISNWLLEYILKANPASIRKFEISPSKEAIKKYNPDLLSTKPKDPRTSEVDKVSASFGIVAGKIKNPKPSGLSAAKRTLFGEDNMNPNKIANDIIREAFTSGDRNNTTPADNTISAKGGTQRQMLSGEFVGSAAWPFDQATNDMFAGSNELQMNQAHAGQGELVGGAMEAVASEIVDNLLEDSPSAILADPDSVGYLINEMCEAGYCAEADKLKDICKDAKEEDVIVVSAMIDKLEAEKADSFLIEQLTRFATQFLISEEDADMPAGASDVNSPKDDAAESTDDNKGGSEA